ENVDYTKKEFIARIRSDKDDGQKNLVRYALRGVGVDQPPFNLFVVNPDNGNVRITGLLDRESIPQFNLSGVATFINGTVAENDIQLRIKVKDQNDNAPIFPPSISPGSVYELSPVGTSVMRITATDADEPGNPNSQIRYEIINQDPAGAAMFRIAPNGDVLVNDANLDREYTLTVKASDLNGAPGCKSGTATFKIQLKDVNDNVPKLEKEAYEGSIEENTEKVEVMRIKATDLDEQGTDNWQAKFNIVSGNEGGHFSIYTDPNTNEGVLMLDKAVDYEEVKGMNLGIAVANVAPYHPSVTGVYNVNIKVKNQPEGPRFSPKVKAIPISEDGKTFDVTKVIATYPAIDGDTKLPAENVRYAKGLDPGNWLSIDEKTGEIRLNKLPDRESPHLVNGTYTAKVLCISQDAPYTTATGTIAIQVEDFNDHCPTLTTNVQTMCTIQEAIYVTAVDEDAPPNAAPFTFSIVPEKTKGKWSVEHLNDTTAILRSHEPLWPGPREVTVEVRDEQGLSCPEPQVLKLDVCSCDKNGLCGVRGAQQKGAVLGKAGIGLLLLGLLMLLLIPLLLLFCQCGAAGMGGAFAEMPFDTKEHLIAYHTEGQGEDRVSPEILSIFHRAGYMASTFSGGGGYQMEMTTMDHGMSAAGLGMMREEFDDGMALSGEYLNQYYSQKSMELDATAKNSLLMYDYEGQGSPVGSIGCCSLLESDNDLEFLNNLGPKFTTLAEICGAVSIETHRVNTVNVPPKPAASSSVHTVENVMVTNSRASVAADVKPATTLINVKPSQTLIDVQPAQTLMVQQQPMYYVVEPQVSNTMLLAERPTVGLGQNVYMLNGAPMAERVLVQGAVPAQGTIGGGNRVMLLETGRGSTQALNTGLLQSANLSGSQLLLVDGAAQGGQVLQGTLNRGGLAGSQGLLLVDGQSGPMLQGSLQRGVATSGSQNMLFMEAQGGSSGVVHGLMQRGMTSSAGSQSGTVGLNTGSVQISGVPSTRKVVIQEKKVVSTQQSSL
uniref:Cadherin domain-containing protein n=1 Tax=Astyanax mexicanus TaxID=7994 RepID=A0A8B9KMN8_ASTMX